MDETQTEIADRLAADLGVLARGYTVSIEPSPSRVRLADLKARGVPYTHDFMSLFPPEMLEALESESEESGPLVSMRFYAADDPDQPPEFVAETSSHAIAIRLDGAAVAWIEFVPDGDAERLLESLDQAQTSVIEEECGAWPLCPVADHPHPLDLFEENGRVGWRCPVDEQFVAWLGEVVRAAKHKRPV